jgi:hypothetical protein
LRKREAEQNVEADWEIDAFMTADTAKGKREAIASEYILRILGLDVSIHVVILSSGLSSLFGYVHTLQAAFCTQPCLTSVVT